MPLITTGTAPHRPRTMYPTRPTLSTMVSGAMVVSRAKLANVHGYRLGRRLLTGRWGNPIVLVVLPWE